MLSLQGTAETLCELIQVERGLQIGSNGNKILSASFFILTFSLPYAGRASHQILEFGKLFLELEPEFQTNCVTLQPIGGNLSSANSFLLSLLCV